MKRVYDKPLMSLELFEVSENVAAVACAPGIDESNVKAELIQCYYYENPREGSCSNRNTSQYFFIEAKQGCTIRLNSDGSVVTSTGIQKEMWCYEHGEATDANGKHRSYGTFFGIPVSVVDCSKGVESYRWDNRTGGYHHIAASDFGGQIGGKPKYFNS